MMAAMTDDEMVAHAESIPVYFAYSENLGLVKIGYSGHVRQRLRSVPTGMRYAGQVSLIGWVLGGPRVESELHHLFNPSHYAGEWFHFTPDIAAWVATNGQSGEPPIVLNARPHVSTLGYWAARRRLRGVA